jgi:hypothetical protein
MIEFQEKSFAGNFTAAQICCAQKRAIEKRVRHVFENISGFDSFREKE